MSRRSYLMVALLVACVAASAQAGIFFSRSKKTPADQVADLTKTLRTDADERHRASAADELSKFDARAFPAAVTTLIESTLKDPSDAVREEAAQALGRIRPISTQSAYALEYTLANDPSSRVRGAAKSALWQYHVAGYRGTAPAPQTAEPGLAPTQRPAAPTAAGRPTPRPSPLPTRPAASPGASTRVAAITPPPAPPAPIKLGSVPSIDPPAAKPAPAKPAKPDDDGPVLNPSM